MQKVPYKSAMFGSRESGIGVEITVGGDINIKARETVGIITLNGKTILNGDKVINGNTTINGNLLVTRDISGTKSGVAAELTEPFLSVAAVIEKFYVIDGAFTNYITSSFELIMVDDKPCIRFIGINPEYFEIDFHASLSSANNGRTVHVGFRKNDEVITKASIGRGIMGVFCKIANEVVPLSTSAVIYLEPEDYIQLQFCSSAINANITFDKITTTIAKFYR